MQNKTLFAILMALFLAFQSNIMARDSEDKDTEKHTAPKAFAAKSKEDLPETGEAKLSIAISGKDIPYVVKTGMTSIFSDDGDEEARIFSTSYIMENADRERPVMFLFNGGPGSASIYLHMGSFGPKILPLDGNGLTLPAPPYKVVDNPDSLLDVTDLVFVDPVGTGYSHVITDDNDDEEKDKDETDETTFWGVESDIDSIAEFVRVWLNENNRWGARIFIAGESYGGLRAAGLVAALQDIGIAPSGVALISPALTYQDMAKNWENLTAQLLGIPGMAAVAHYHKRLAPDLQKMPLAELVGKVSQWCVEKYLPGLLKGNLLAKNEYDELVNDMSRFTGIPATEIRAYKLRLDAGDFSSRLLRDEGLFFSIYDGRLTAPLSASGEYMYSEDPINTIAGEPYKTAFQRFLTEVLKLKTYRKYNYSAEDAFAEWDFTMGNKGSGGYPTTVSYLSTAMRRLPFLRVFLIMGRYDLVTPAESAIQSISRLDIPNERLKNIQSRIYEGGHMMYTNSDARQQVSADMRAWIKSSMQGGQ